MKVSGFTHDSANNQTIDWYTPKSIFDSLGVVFDLDPCAPKGGVPWIPAKKFYSLEDDGLTQPWSGNVWLNPPYGRQTIDWLERMDAHRQGIALVFARTDCKWFHDYCAKATAINFIKGRIKFVDGLGVTGNSGAGAGSMLIAWGDQNANAIKNVDGLTLTL